jgi:threonyl-tRNA synthetase
MPEDRKSPEARQQMSEIDRLRHSCAHILATAILRIWPEAQFAAGPPVENGFYYDLEMDHHLSPADFDKIEAEMKRVVKENQPFEKIVLARQEALELAK